MKKTQKVNHHRELIERLLYAAVVWRSLSERQQELISDQAGW